MVSAETRFDLDPALETFRVTVRDLATSQLAPLVADAERDQRLPPQVFRRLADADLLGLGTGEPFGGSGAGLAAQCVLVEEVARVCSGFATSLIVQLAVVPGALEFHGTAAQAQRWLPGMVRGELLGSLAVTEPDTGSDIRSLTARAVARGDGWSISGTKVFITNGTLADFYIVAAVVDPDAGHRGIGLFLVERDNPGLVSVAKMDKTSVRSSDTAELVFDDAFVAGDALVGGDLNGFVKLMSTFDRERILHASRALGLARAAFEAASSYSTQRQQFGQPIREFQAIAFKLADMDVGIEASRLLIYRAAWLADEGRDVRREAAIAKLFATEASRTICVEAMQIHGSYGLTAEFPTGRFVADSLLETIGTGTSEIQRVIISRLLAR
jgi:alkylation response protein AidB-like acyl-CoA dehydrogenase